MTDWLIISPEDNETAGLPGNIAALRAIYCSGGHTAAPRILEGGVDDLECVLRDIGAGLGWDSGWLGMDSQWRRRDARK